MWNMNIHKVLVSKEIVSLVTEKKRERLQTMTTAFFIELEEKGTNSA